MGAEPAVDVVVVNYNAGDALTRCIHSVLNQRVPVRITVVDNASTDDSMVRLENSIGRPENLALVSNPENLGFATAVNEATGGMDGDSDYLLILNPDCEMQPGALAALCSALDNSAGAALAGPVVVDNQGQPMRGALRRFPDPWSSFLTFSGLWRLGQWFPSFSGVEMMNPLPAETARAEAVSGACMLVRRPEFIAMGGMDGSYGLHCEDLDLMYRLHLRNFHCLYVPSARVFHEQGVSSGSRPLWVHWQKHRGMQRFFQKFQANQHRFPFRWLVITGIWLRYAVTLPTAWFRS